MRVSAMNTQFHTPSFGDEIFDLDDNNTSTPATINNINSVNNCSMSTGNVVANNIGNANYMYHQQQTTPQQTKRMIDLHNNSDEYHTANEDSFNASTNTVTLGGNSSIQASGQQQQVAAVVSTTAPTPTLAARKQMSPTDTNEPAKPLSAYALFFRDTVSAIKQQNPTCSFQELSKIVASMWDALDPSHKSVYNNKNELARNEYIKQMRAYRLQQEQQASAQSQTAGEVMQPAAAAVAAQTNIPTATKPAIFTMNINQQQGQVQQEPAQTVQPSHAHQQMNPQQQHAAVSQSDVNSSAPAEDQSQILSESAPAQKCTRDGCTKLAIINPDWEDEYCSNECVVVHCRNVFNDWVKSNLENKRKSELQQQQQTQAT